MLKLYISTGVPHGSILGPLLFVIYMNDISEASTIFDFVLYADDTSLTCSLENRSPHGTDKTDANKIINNELDQIYTWLSSNKLSLNVSKSKFMVFHLPCKDVSSLGSIQLAIKGVCLTRAQEFDFFGNGNF